MKKIKQKNKFISLFKYNILISSGVMKIIPFYRSCFFLFLFVTSFRAYSMQGIFFPKENQRNCWSPKQVEREKFTASLDNAAAKQTRRTNGELPSEKINQSDSASDQGDEIFCIVKSVGNSAVNSPNNSTFGYSQNDGTLNLDFKKEANQGGRLKAREKSAILRETEEKDPRFTLDQINERLSDIEQIIATASEKNKVASNAASAIDINLVETASSMKKNDFNTLANLWAKLVEVSSLLREETDQLRKLRMEIERSPSLLQSQSEIPIDQASFEKKRLAQDEIDLLTNAITHHEKMIHFLFRGTTIIDEWIHDLWTNHLIFAVSSSSDAPVNDLGMMEVEKENCYKNGVSILQILAANHSEDEDQEIASFFARVADSEYDKMKNIFLDNSERRDEIIKNNKSILAFCSTVNSLQEKIRENKDLAQQSPEERAVILYQDAVQWHREHCHLIMSMVEQLILDNEGDLASSENRSKILNELASGAEAQARRIEQLSAEKGSLRFGARIVNETSGGK
ncbi:MAG: hypothetical protein K2W97_07135 [Chthoniobacterales bacterium]|nr:hypothetical protein [Chthoniobacterales bacterium]